jgi:hypothetical protein
MPRKSMHAAPEGPVRPPPGRRSSPADSTNWDDAALLGREGGQLHAVGGEDAASRSAEVLELAEVEEAGGVGREHPITPKKRASASTANPPSTMAGRAATRPAGGCGAPRRASAGWRSAGRRRVAAGHRAVTVARQGPAYTHAP